MGDDLFRARRPVLAIARPRLSFSSARIPSDRKFNASLRPLGRKEATSGPASYPIPERIHLCVRGCGPCRRRSR